MSEKKLMKHLDMQGLTSLLSKLCKGRVLDIVIFGSVAKGKENPSDVDLAVILREENYELFDNVASQIREILSQLKTQIEMLCVEKLFEEPLFLTLLHEGISCRHKKPLAAVLKTKSVVLVTYDLANLNKSQKTLFGYALRGRTGEKGTLYELGGEVAGRNAFILPTDELEKVKALLAHWKVKFGMRRMIWLPSYLC